MKYRWLVSLALVAGLLGGCSVRATPDTAVESPTATHGTLPTFTPAISPGMSVTPGASETVPVEEPTPTPEATAVTIRVEPTFTPRQGGDGLEVSDLPIGEPGQYVNVTFGYWLQYPAGWYTGFGNRPLLASFSNLDPGTHNRDSMRAGGCLLEVTSSVDFYGSPLSDIVAQLPGIFPNAQDFELDGLPASRVPPSEEVGVSREVVLAAHEGRLLILTFSYATATTEVCAAEWETVLGSWKWLSPDAALYVNSAYGYAVSHPRSWYRFNASDRGLFISDVDPTAVRELHEITSQGMLVRTDVIENPGGLPLKQWVAAQGWDMHLSNDIPLDELLGVRVIRSGPTEDVQEMSGYFQGPTGEIHAITCQYPAAREWEFRPIANAIIYSFTF